MLVLISLLTFLLQLNTRFVRVLQTYNNFVVKFNILLLENAFLQPLGGESKKDSTSTQKYPLSSKPSPWLLSGKRKEILCVFLYFMPSVYAEVFSKRNVEPRLGKVSEWQKPFLYSIY